MSDESKDIARQEYYEARKANIKENIDCSDVLTHFGVNLLYDNSEVQYRCPLHGDGRDDQKSARYYPESDDTYCWGCQEYRDHIGLVMDFEGCSFTEALHYLESEWNLDVPSIYDFTRPSSTESNQQDDGETGIQRDIDAIFEDDVDIMDRCGALESKIDRVVDEYDVDTGPALKLYHAYDYLLYCVRNEVHTSRIPDMWSSLDNKIDEIRHDED